MLFRSVEDSGPRLITQAELLANPTDVDGPGLTATGLAISSGSGTLVDNGDGTWTYTPALNDDTAVSFSYTVTDGSLTAAGTATLDITPVNDAPLGGGDTVLVIDGFPLQLDPVGLLANDVDPDGDVLQIVAVSPPGFGTLVDNGNGTWTYIPQAGFTGVDTFSYQVADPSGATDTVTVTLLVTVTPAVTGDDGTGPGIGPTTGGGSGSGPGPGTGTGGQGSGKPADNSGAKPAAGNGGGPASEPDYGGQGGGFAVPPTSGHGTQVMDMDSDDRRSHVVGMTAKSFFDSVPNLQAFLELNHALGGLRGSIYQAMWHALDNMKHQMSDANGSQDPTHRVIVQVATGTSIAMSAGFVAWLLRGGALAASMLSSLPLWSSFDPIPVLFARRKRREDERPQDQAGTPDQADLEAEAALASIFRSRSAVLTPRNSEA